MPYFALPTTLARRALAAAAAALLVLDLIGLARPGRPIRRVPQVALFASNLTLAPAEARRLAVRRAGESDTAFVARLTTVVHRAMGHYWPDSANAPISARVPLTDNFLLWGAALVRPDVFARYEYLDADRALDRGFGLCSQFAVVLHRLLRDQGIATRYVSLRGHVVVEALAVPGGARIADADFGVVVPYPLAVVERAPELVRPFYTAAIVGDSRRLGEVTATDIVGIYGPEGNVAVASPDDAAGGKRGAVHAAERFAYVAKWLLPIGLLLAALASPDAPAPRRRGRLPAPEPALREREAAAAQ